MDPDALVTPRQRLFRWMLEPLPLLAWVVGAVALLWIEATNPGGAPLAGVAALMCTIPPVLIYGGVLAGMSVARMRASRRVTRAVEASSLALAEGRPEDAEAVLQEAASGRWVTPANHVSLLVAQAACHLGRADPEAARAVLRHPVVAPWIGSPLLVLRRCAAELTLAVCAVALDDAPAARRALEAARRAQRPNERWVVDAIEVLVLARAGEHEAAVARGEALECARLPGPLYALARTAAAHSAAALGRPTDALLDGVRLRTGRPKWAHAFWPELVAPVNEDTSPAS